MFKDYTTREQRMSRKDEYEDERGDLTAVIFFLFFVALGALALTLTWLLGVLQTLAELN